MNRILILLLVVSSRITAQVTASFVAPDTVCVNTPVQITNTSVGATSYYWSFCTADINQPPAAVNIGNPGNLSAPVFMDYAYSNGNYYGFITNYNSGNLVRLDFGTSLLNSPVSVNLGNFGGILQSGSAVEGIQIVQNEGKWYAIIVGGNASAGTQPRIVKIDFGTDITNLSPIATNWGNLGNMAQAIDLHVFKENNNWYGFTVNSENNTITRFDFTNSFDNIPTAINLGNIGNLAYPTGIYAINDNGFWRVFVVNGGDNMRIGANSSITRLDFGSSLLNTPTGINLGNPGNKLHHPRDITIMKFCGQIIGFAVNGNPNYNDIVRLDFNNNLSSVPTIAALGNIGNLDFPHSISKLFRVNDDVFSFITNVANNTITRLHFPGCTNSSINSSTAQNPPPITYNVPGIYNINLSVDDGLPTQTSYCRQVVVQPCGDEVFGIINNYTPVLSLNPCENKITVEDAFSFNIGDTVLMIQMKGAVIDSSNTSSFGTITDYKNSGNYEFNYVKSKSGNIIELKNKLTRQYDIPNGKVQLIRVPYYQNTNVTSTLTCLPWDGSKGGVLVLNVQDTITLNANIDVSGKGFKGGASLNTQNVNWVCNSPNYYYPVGAMEGAAKGEGIADISALKKNGKGRLANGGGGGNQSNAGGGGGGNAGSGGFGGNQFEFCPTSFDNRGIGGIAPSVINQNKVFLGGGGGSGDANNPPPPTSFSSFGGNGGGIIIISADKIITTNVFKIQAKGDPGLDCNTGNCHEGMGGGGAGGTILLNVTNYVGGQQLMIEANGGKGADAIHTISASQYRHGPGGGGGGGLIWFSNGTNPSNVTANINGGLHGVNTNFGNDPWGAISGQNGGALFNLTVPFDNVLFTPNIDSVRIQDSATSCKSFDFRGFGFTNTNPISTWEWFFGDGGTANTQNTSHTYNATGTYTVKLVVTDINGCKDSITKNVNAVSLNFDFNYQFNTCNPLTVQFHGIGNDTQNPYWDFGDGGTNSGNLNPGHTYGTQGNYTVKYSISNGTCSDTLTKIVSLNIINDNIILTNDTTICYGNTKQLFTVPALSFCWSPITYLNDPNLPNPIASPPTNITYYYTAEVTGNNLIVNGDFSAGNTGFTSQYVYANPNVTEGQYFIGTNSQTWNPTMSSCHDHTTGSGNMMMVNGAPVAGVNVWTESVTVVPNTNYAFSTWIEALWPPNPAQLQFSINGSDLGPMITASLPTCTWTQFYTTWNSGNNTSATISIVNKNTQIQGNDFALDDISFAPIYIKRDSVKILVDTPLVKTNNDTTFCAGGSAQLNATGGISYSWSPPIGLSNPNIPNPIASPPTTTQYIVTGTNANGCVAEDTVLITINAKPLITKSNDTTICQNISVQLFASGGTSYSWSPAATLNNPNIANPIATPTTNTTYYVTVTNAGNCSNDDSVKIDIKPSAVFSVSPDNSTCFNMPVQLNASGGDIYSWTPSTDLSNPNISDPQANPALTTTYTVNITESACNESTTLTTKITVLPLPTISASKQNDIDCSNDASQLNASGALQYSWSPSSTLNNPNISNPIARPTTSTLYSVRGTDLNGCTNTDTISVLVLGINKGGYLMPNAFTPNNDGINDCYGIKYWGIILELDFSIYNRWGERIFHTKTPGQCWDGTYKGILQNPDVYVYMVKAKTSCDNNVFRKGTFVLIR